MLKCVAGGYHYENPESYEATHLSKQANCNSFRNISPTKESLTEYFLLIVLPLYLYLLKILITECVCGGVCLFVCLESLIFAS